MTDIKKPLATIAAMARIGSRHAETQVDREVFAGIHEAAAILKVHVDCLAEENARLRERLKEVRETISRLTELTHVRFSENIVDES